MRCGAIQCGAAQFDAMRCGSAWYSAMRRDANAVCLQHPAAACKRGIPLHSSSWRSRDWFAQIVV